MKLQDSQYQDQLQKPIGDAMNSAAVRPMNDNDARTTLVVITKLKNQVGNYRKIAPLLNNPTKEEIVNAVNQQYSKVVRESVGKVIQGAELHNTLVRDKGPLGGIFQSYMEKDPSLMQSGFHTHAEAQVLDAMFRNPTVAQKLIDAVIPARLTR